MATIPISQIVTVNPAVLSAAGAAVDLNGLILTQSTYTPIGSVVPFATAASVGAYFGISSTEYQLAQIYFAGYQNCTKTPGILYFSQYASTAVAGYVRGGSLASMILAQLKLLTGTLTVTIDGGTPKTSSTINLSAATSFSNAATIIQAAFTSLGATVSFDTVQSAFVFTSSTTGATSSVSAITGTLSASLMLTTATGAVISAGSAAMTPSGAMDAIVAVTQNWALFTTVFEPVLSDKQLFSAWTNGKQPRYAYVGADSDVNATVANSTTTWGYYLTSNNVSGTIPVYGNNTHSAFILGFAASLDFTRTNGRSTLAFKYQSGLVASVTDATAASNLDANGYNFYGSYANAKQGWNFMYPGSVSGVWAWVDSYLNQIWLNANLQLAMVNLLLNVGSVPYNSQGYSLVESACADPINAAVNFGAIRVGVKLSDSQKSQMQYALGIDVSQAIYAKGYYLQILDASAATRVARTSPPMTLYYTDGGSIQQLTLASIEIQ